MESFGARLRMLRKAAGLTQGQLGEKLNVSSSTITKWECTRYSCQPDAEHLVALADYFKVSLDYLTCRDCMDHILHSVECHYEGVFSKCPLRKLLDIVQDLDKDTRKEFFRYAEFLSEKTK